jgi:hypothetical protein
LGTPPQSKCSKVQIYFEYTKISQHFLACSFFLFEVVVLSKKKEQACDKQTTKKRNTKEKHKKENHPVITTR